MEGKDPGMSLPLINRENFRGEFGQLMDSVLLARDTEADNSGNSEDRSTAEQIAREKSPESMGWRGGGRRSKAGC